MSNKDPWDELLRNMGKGWPHYKHLALPLIMGPQAKRCTKPLKYLVLTQQIRNFRRRRRW